MANYKVPNSSSIWTNPTITLHLDEDGKPLIYNTNLSKMEISLMVRFEVSNDTGSVNHNWLCDKIKVDSFPPNGASFDPTATMGKFIGGS
jgi:hypothetical protein